MYTGGKSMANIAKELGLYSSMVGYRVKILGISRSISESLVGQAKSKSHRKTLSENRINSGVARGSKNPNWQGGVSTEHDKIRHNIEQRLWKRAVKRKRWCVYELWRWKKSSCSSYSSFFYLSPLKNCYQ